MRLSLIVPATDRPSTLPRVLAAIAAADQGPDELIVVDWVGEPGPSAARNAGAWRATGDVLAFVDSDVEVHADAFTRIRSAFAADPLLTATFGSYDDDPESPSLVSSFRNLLHHHVHQRSRGPAATFWVGLGAVRRENFDACGGFDARRYRNASIEDIDLGVRLVSRGARIVLDPHLQGKHLKHWSALSMLRTDLLRRGVPWVELLLRERRMIPALNLCWRSSASAGATGWLLWALVRQRPRATSLALAASLGLNVELYGLLIRQRGLRMAVAGPGLHALHHLAALASLPCGLVMFVFRAGSSDSSAPVAAAPLP